MLKTMPNWLLRQLAPVALLATLLGGCAMQPPVTQSWLIPEPLAVSYRTELAIARLSEILIRAELSDEQSAQLYYDRGVMYDSVGLRSLARLDFIRALRLKPDMADAYNFIGIHHTIGGEYAQAYEAFDSALELAPEHEFAYLNRGIALYYDGKSDLAISDFQTFLQLKPDDAYRMIWLYLAQSSVSVADAKVQLAANARALKSGEWSSNIVQFLLGEMTEKALLDSVVVDLSSQQMLAERLCEVYFYLAKWHESQQQPELAMNYYKLVLATNVYEFVEHRYARVEMSRLRGDAIATDGYEEP